MKKKQAISPPFAKQDHLNIDFYNKARNQVNLPSSTSLTLNQSYQSNSKSTFRTANSQKGQCNNLFKKLIELPKEEEKYFQELQDDNRHILIDELEYPKQQQGVKQLQQQRVRQLQRQEEYEIIDMDTKKQNHQNQSVKSQRNLFDQIDDQNDQYSNYLQKFDSQHLYLPYQERQSLNSKTKFFQQKEPSKKIKIEQSKIPKQQKNQSKIQNKNQKSSPFQLQSLHQINQPQNKPLQNQSSTHQKLICFKCGGPHYFNQCSLHVNIARSSQLKCFNCKKTGHTARYCRDPKRCSYCQSTEHLARDCTSSQVNQLKKVCGNCYKPGHFAKQCQQPRRCFLCHQFSHQVKDCPKNKQNRLTNEDQMMNINEMRPITCFNCKKPGHYANFCNQPERCHNCNQEGHYSRDCPYMRRSLSVINSTQIKRIQQQKEQQKEEHKKQQFRQRANSESAADSKSKKLDTSKFYFRKYMRDSKKTIQSKSKSKIKSNSKWNRSRELSKKIKEKKMMKENQNKVEIEETDWTNEFY